MPGTTQRRDHRVLALAAIAAASACIASSGGAQVIRRAVRVQVTDTAGAPLGGANLAILTLRRDTLGTGITGDDGRATIPIDSGAGDRQIVARQIGYSRSDLWVRLMRAETLSVRLMMRRAATTLATVTITERQRTPYDFIGADEIDSMSTLRTIYEARDIVMKLRPDMLNEHHCALDGANSRGTAVIANGRVSVRRAPRPGATRATIWVNGIRVFSPGIPPDSVLAEIFAEHVQEIKYENCGSTTDAKNGGNNAIFVTLKPGIAFDLRNGSSVIDAEAANRATPRKP